MYNKWNFLFQERDTSGPLGAFPTILDVNEDEVTYADADYKDIYEFGPVSYKNASEAAAVRKKAELANRFTYKTIVTKPKKQN